MAFGKMLNKLMQKPNVQKMFKQIKQKNSKPRTVNVIAPKSKPIKTSGGLLTNNIKTNKKKLLGS